MLDPVLAEWGGQLLRWIHVIAAIAWIGSSFYFIHLDLSLRRAEGLPAGVSGEAWQVHGGGFYRMQKYGVAPPELPPELTWFKWEAYATWITGFFLLVWIYYGQAELYTIDPEVLALAPWQAALVGVGSLVLGWFLYDRLCRSTLGRNDVLLGAALLALIVAAAYGYTRLFSPRAAFLHTGALVATWMAGSVLLVIIPNQRTIVADLLAGRSPDPALGRQSKQRSLHNNYFTLPVLFLMLSNHYPLAWSSRWNWLIVGLVVVAGAVVRHFYNERHAGRASPWWVWAVAAGALGVAIILSVQGRPALAEAGSSKAEASTPAFDAALLAIQSRCSMCHAPAPLWPGITAAPKGVRLDTPEAVRRHGEAIRLQSVLTRAMPPNNLTGMTLEERRAVAAWLDEARRR
jgi:uncharacterized membrane protein